MTAAGTEAGQIAIDFTNKALWDIFGTSQPGFFYLGEKIWEFFNGLFLKMTLVNDMKKNTKKRLMFSFLVAFGISVFNVLHKKFGGLLVGGVYSDSHSWQEIYYMLPSSLVFFCVVFIFAYCFLYLKYK